MNKDCDEFEMWCKNRLIKNDIYSAIFEGMTNGEVIKTIFDVDEIQVTENTVIVRVKGSFCAKMQFLLDWWNAPYNSQEGANEYE